MSIDPALIAAACEAFRNGFDAEPDFLVHAPGRVNLIGEHTDYNDGFVLPMAIGYGTAIAGAAGPDSHVTAIAANFDNARDGFDSGKAITPQGAAEWALHIRGVGHALTERGYSLGGGRLAIAGNVPQGAGLSSSASLGVATGMALARLTGIDALSPTDFALIAQRAEHNFVGTQCGIMDQLVSARAEAGGALLIDCRSLDCSAVAMPDDVAVLIIHSGVARELADSAYNERRAQCEAAARHFGAPALRDVTAGQLESGGAGLDPLTLKRARHVVTENDRVLAAADALQSGDLAALGNLMAASHASMRDDFEITVPKIDELVAITQTAIGSQGGARMTGGGFGGCVVAVCRESEAERVKAAIAQTYRTPSNTVPAIFICRAEAGARFL